MSWTRVSEAAETTNTLMHHYQNSKQKSPKQQESQSGFCNDTFQPAKLNSGIRNIVISPVVFKPHSIDETPALYTNECARICLSPVSPAFPRIFLTPKDTKDNARINVEVHDRSVRISASIRSTSTFFSRFSGFTFLAAAGGSIASSIIRSSS